MNRKVERSQKTDRIEFYALDDLPFKQLAEELECWQTTYSYRRPHGSLGGKTPMQRVCELYEKTPYSDEVFMLTMYPKKSFELLIIRLT